jgi:large subunit ribosomal protein L23Ae
MESANVKTEDNTLFILDVKAKKHQIRQTLKKFCDTDVAKINTLIQSHGQKKACVQLSPDYVALYIANKTESSWLIQNMYFFTIKKIKGWRSGSIARASA